MSLTYTQQAIDRRDARIKELEAEVAALKAERDGTAKTDPAAAPVVSDDDRKTPFVETEVEHATKRRR